MAGYTREFLVDAYVSRYESVSKDVSQLRDMAVKHYDKVGKDAFRASASLDAQEIKKFKLATGRKSQYNRHSFRDYGVASGENQFLRRSNVIFEYFKKLPRPLPWLESENCFKGTRDTWLVDSS